MTVENQKRRDGAWAIYWEIDRLAKDLSIKAEVKSLCFVVNMLDDNLGETVQLELYAGDTSEAKRALFERRLREAEGVKNGLSYASYYNDPPPLQIHWSGCHDE